MSLFQSNPSIRNIQTIKNAVMWKMDFHDIQHPYHNLLSVSKWGREWMLHNDFNIIWYHRDDHPTCFYHLITAAKRVVTDRSTIICDIADTWLIRIRMRLVSAMNFLTYVKCFYGFYFYFYKTK